MFPWWSLRWRLGSMFPQQQKWADSLNHVSEWSSFEDILSATLPHLLIPLLQTFQVTRICASAHTHAHGYVQFLTNLSVLSAAQCLSLACSHKQAKEDTPLIKSIVSQGTGLKWDSSSLDNNCIWAASSILRVVRQSLTHLGQISCILWWALTEFWPWDVCVTTWDVHSCWASST